MMGDREEAVREYDGPCLCENCLRVERDRSGYSLSEFEAKVLAQQPATAPWTPVTDYSFEARKQVEGRQPELILQHLVQCEDADILGYGCGPDAHLVRLLREAVGVSQISIIGYDPQRPGPSPFLDMEPTWDLVICREVLEHLTVRDIAATVRDLCAITSGLIYVTTRFAKSPSSLLDFDTSDDLDPTHITMLNQDFLRVLFVLEGFKRRADLEQQMDWQKKGRVLVYERAA